MTKTIAPTAAQSPCTTGGATRPWTTAGYATAQWKARLRPPLPTATRHVVPNGSLPRKETGKSNRLD
jgi:hypothetical protein